MYNNGSTRSENDVKVTGPFDFLEDYSATPSIVLGVLLVLFGILSVSLGLGSLCTLASAHSIGYGIWCGILFCVSGVFCVFAGYKKSVCMVMLTCISCIISSLLAVVQISLAITATQNDSPPQRQNMLIKKLEPGYLRYDIYYKRNTAPLFLCSNPDNPFTWEASWAPVDILLILCGLVVFVCATLASCLSCVAVNKGPRLIRTTEPAGKNQETFGNEIYYTDRRK